jgi:ribosomal-protein-alanine N-acetyltransferase
MLAHFQQEKLLNEVDLVDLDIVQLGVADVQDLIELEKMCFAYHWTHDQFCLGLERGAFRVLGIQKGGRLAGYIAFSLIEDEMEILNLAVHPDFRRKRLAANLLDRAFEVCVKNKIAKSFLDVKASNSAALKLYRKYGYKQIGVRKKYYPDTKEDALLFRYDFKQGDKITVLKGTK